MSDIENGRRNVSLETIVKLAGFFVISASELGHVIYSYPRMLEHLVLNDGMTYEEAAEFIDYNTIGSLPCMGVPRPRSVILSGAQRSRRIQTSNVLQDRGPGRAIF